MTSKKLLITGGAGFIGSTVIRHIKQNKVLFHKFEGF